MFDIVRERIRQKYRTLDYPRVRPSLSPLYRGLPELKVGDCGGCRACVNNCPTGALSFGDKGLELDMGRCLFCGRCQDGCAQGRITFTGEHRVAAFRREDLIIRPGISFRSDPQKDYSLFARSLKLREVCAGGCNACDADTNVLTTLNYDLGRFGIDYVASPRHADGIAVTGPVTENMRAALLDTFAAVPEPKIVVAIGSCAISGGLFAESKECRKGVTDLLPVDVFIPGCPPNPWSILDALLRVTGKS